MRGFAWRNQVKYCEASVPKLLAMLTVMLTELIMSLRVRASGWPFVALGAISI